MISCACNASKSATAIEAGLLGFILYHARSSQSSVTAREQPSRDGLVEHGGASANHKSSIEWSSSCESKSIQRVSTQGASWIPFFNSQTRNAAMISRLIRMMDGRRGRGRSSIEVLAATRPDRCKRLPAFLFGGFRRGAAIGSRSFSTRTRLAGLRGLCGIFFAGIRVRDSLIIQCTLSQQPAVRNDLVTPRTEEGRGRTKPEGK